MGDIITTLNAIGAANGRIAARFPSSSRPNFPIADRKSGRSRPFGSFALRGLGISGFVGLAAQLVASLDGAAGTRVVR